MRNLFVKTCLLGLLSAAVAAGCGDSDDDGGSTQQTTVPTPQLGLAADLMATVEQDPLRVLLTWDYTGNEEVEFAVYRAGTAQALALQNLTAARLLATTDDVVYVDEDVVPGNTYYYRVRAFQGRQIGRASQLIAVTIAADGTGEVEVVEGEQPPPGDDGTVPPPGFPDDDTDGTFPDDTTNGTDGNGTGDGTGDGTGNGGNGDGNGDGGTNGDGTGDGVTATTRPKF